MINEVTNAGFMSGLSVALWGEFQKVRRSKTLWISVIIFTLITIIAGLFIFILKEPELAHRLGILGDKAEIFGGTADWSGFLNLVLLMVTIGGLVIFGFIFIWIFGREFNDKTVYDMLSLPVSRITIVSAKIIIGLCWSLALVLLAFLVMLGIGAILQLPGWSGAEMMSVLLKMIITSLFNILLCIPFGLVASITRSYLPSVGSIFLVLVLAEVFNTIGYGMYFPWSIPSLYNGSAGVMTGAIPEPLGIASYLLVGIVSIAGLIVTGVWWKYADQS